MNNPKHTPRKQKDNNTLPAGSLPPQAMDAEASILGVLLLHGHHTDSVHVILAHAECFYAKAHQLIYGAILSLYHGNYPVDLLTVTDELRKADMLEHIGGPYYLVQLVERVTTVAHVEAHARIVMEKYIKRELIRTGGQIMTDAYDAGTDPFELLDAAEEQVHAIGGHTSRSMYKHVSAEVAGALNAIEEAGRSKDYTGVPTGYAMLDRVTYGWQPQDLIIIAARPSVGKTAFVLNLALNAVMHPQRPVPVAFFSLEMGTRKLVNRCLAAMSGIALDKLKRGRVQQHEWMALTLAGNKLTRLPLYLDDTGGINIYELRSKARKMVRTHDVGLIIIDYLQLMQGVDNHRNSNRENEVAKISRDLKALAKELNIPVIALSQLNRAVETRKEQRGEPFLADLRESGAIEQDADSVLMLWRPDYQDAGGNAAGGNNDVYLKVAKNRDGMTEKLCFKVRLDIQRFYDPEGWEAFEDDRLIS